MLSDAQIKEIMDDVSGGNPDRYFSYTSTTIELCRAIEAAVRAELAGQEPVAWVYYPKGVGEKYFTFTNPASLDLGKNAGWIAHIQPLYAAPVVQPDMVKAVKALLEKLPQPGSRNWPHFYAMAELKAVHDMVAAAEKEQR